jgi:hypothetical protein
MKYRVTIFNVGFPILIVWAIYIYSNASKRDNEGWGLLVLMTLLSIGVIGFLIDLVLQKYIKKYITILIIEIVLIGVIWVFDKWYGKEKIIVLPDNFKGYLTIVYGVTNSPPLYESKLNFGYKVVIPSSGILFTSTSMKEDISNTTFQKVSGQSLDNPKRSILLYALPYDNGNFVCNGKNWDFRTWLIKNGPGWNKQIDIDTLTIKSLNNYCKNIN